MTEIQKYLETCPILTPVVSGYPLEGSKVLLGLRKKVSFGLGENLISGIGGKLEEGEAPDEALIREFIEEVTVKPSIFRHMGQVIFLFPHKEKWNQICDIYLIDEWEGEPLETEAINPLWFDKNELPESQMWDDNLIWLPKVLDGQKVTGTFLFNEENKVIENTFQQIPA